MAFDVDSIRRFSNADHTGLIDVLAHYKAATGHEPPAGVCIDVAGPVFGETARLTNRDWEMSCSDLSQSTGATHAIILNDLQAQGYALDQIAESDLFVLSPGAKAPAGSNRVVVNVGTGFNIAPVFQHNGMIHVPASEAGHAGLSAVNDADLKLAKFVSKDHGFAAVEDVLSGRGLERVYRWCAEEAGRDAPHKSAAEIMADIDDPLAAQAISTFGLHLGRLCGDYALEFLAFGGIYLVGGVARAMAPHLDHVFLEEFSQKGRFSDLVKTMGLCVITDDYAGLRGCAAHLSALMCEKTLSR